MGGSVLTENPKGGIAENFGRIQRGDHSNLLRKRRHSGGGGSRNSSNGVRGDHYSEVTFKGGICDKANRSLIKIKEKIPYSSTNLLFARKEKLSSIICFMSIAVIFDEICTFVLNCPFSDFLS